MPWQPIPIKDSKILELGVTVVSCKKKSKSKRVTGSDCNSRTKLGEGKGTDKEGGPVPIDCAGHAVPSKHRVRTGTLPAQTPHKPRKL